MEKPEFSVIILFSSEECQRRVLSYMRSQKSDEQFVIYQLFFYAENRVVNGLHANLKFCIIFGRVKLFRKPLKSYYGDLSNLVKAVAAVSPPAAKVSCFAQPEMPIVSVHTTEDLSMKSFKYFGSTEAIKKFQEKLDKGALNGVQLADNHDDDASEPVVPVASSVDDTEQDNLLDSSAQDGPLDDSGLDGSVSLLDDSGFGGMKSCSSGTYSVAKSSSTSVVKYASPVKFVS